MRVLYDGVIYRIQRYGGVVRYFNGLIHHLPNSVHPILLAPNRPAVAPRHPNLETYIETCETILWPIKPLRKKIIARRSFNRVVAEKPDVIHPTYYYSSLRHLNQRIDIPTVLTVYDLIHERFPELMDPYGKQTRLKKHALDRADAVICISESTKEDLQEFYKLPDDRIRVIYPGCEFTPLNQLDDDHPALNQPRPDRPYLLFVGERGSYKNFDRMLMAFGKAAKRHPELQLRCIGGKPFSRKEKQLLSELGVSKQVTQARFLNDHDMQVLYSKALALIYPSLYEGFGIPILESMACGTAVLTSNRASMPEVAGDAAILFDPYSIDEMAEAILCVLEDESQRSDMVTKGLNRASHFSLDKSAKDTLEVYQSVARTPVTSDNQNISKRKRDSEVAA